MHKKVTVSPLYDDLLWRDRNFNRKLSKQQIINTWCRQRAVTLPWAPIVLSRSEMNLHAPFKSLLWRHCDPGAEANFTCETGDESISRTINYLDTLMTSLRPHLHRTLLHYSCSLQCIFLSLCRVWCVSPAAWWSFPEMWFTSKHCAIIIHSHQWLLFSFCLIPLSVKIVF